MIGTALSHFKVTAKLGAGGMGEVYRAEDTKLGREVAIKVLPAELADDPERFERFQREARTIAALNHPNIVTIYSVEEAVGVHFLAMELVEGKSLEELIPAGGVTLERFFELAMPIADALATAHGRGIVHRDLKPTNVMVTDEGARVKVLDFGLAKLTGSSELDGLTEMPTEALTQEGLILGTPHYMSPEQAKGEPVDQRSDIFSLGVMLYELATGDRPFQGKSSIELLSSVLKDDPATVSQVRPELPRHLGRVIGRSLEKVPVDRYQTARDVYNELKTLRRETLVESSKGAAPGPSADRSSDAASPTAVAPSPTPSQSAAARRGSTPTGVAPGSDTLRRQSGPEAPWIAVLPIECRTADPDLEAFADGLTEDITAGLSRFSYLMVVSRSSIRRLEEQSLDGSPVDGLALDARQAGRELGARFAVEGSLRKAGSRMRINIQVIDARTGTHIWTETFDRNLDESAILDLQDEITNRVVATTADPHGVLARSMAMPTAAKPPEELTPYEAVLRFFLYQQRGSAADHLPTRTALEHAAELEPDNPDVLACLTIVLVDEDRHAFNPRRDALDRALKTAQRATAADPANQLANHALATAHYFRRELGSFRSIAERAITLNPRDSFTMAILGIFMGYAGDWQRGLELTNAAMDLNPHHPGWYRFTTFFHAYHQKRYEEAVAIVEKMNLPEYFATHYAMAIAQAQLGHLAEAKAAIRECLRLWPDFEREIVGGHLEKWMFAQPDLIDHIAEGLEKCGLQVRQAGEAADQRAAASEPIASDRIETRSDPIPGPAESDPVVTADSRGALGTPWVGRQFEREQLDRMLTETSNGVGGLVLLGGEPGVGKTRLASEILEDARKLGMVALAGHAYEDETAPFIVSAEILEQLVRITPQEDLRHKLGNNAAELARLLPELRQLYPDLPEAADMPPELKQRYLFKNVFEFLERLSAEAPMVLLLDDLHWADESSLQLLEYLVARIQDLRLLMVGTYRNVEADIGKPFERAMARLVRQARVERIRLKPFDGESVAELLAALGRPQPPLALVEAIHQATEGNVFFVEETFRHLAEEKRLFDQSGEWSQAIDVEHLEVPEGVRMVTARRLDRLGDATRSTLAVASMIGLRFSISDLESAVERAVEAGAVDIGDRAVLDAMEESAAAQLVRPFDSGRELHYEFVHALARQSLVDGISPLRQQRLHLAIADAIEQRGAESAERRAAELAHHLVGAGGSVPVERVVGWLETAGVQASGAAANEEAAHYFDTALRSIEQGDAEAEAGALAAIKARLLHERGSARLSLGHREESIADLTAAFETFERLGQGGDAAAVVSELSYMLIWNARPDEAKVLIHRALDLIGDESSEARSRLLSAQGLAHGMAREPSKAERAHAGAVEMARAEPSRHLLGEALQNQAIDGWFRLNGVLLEEAGHEAASIRRELHQEWNLGHCLWMEQAGLVWQGRYDEAEAINDELQPLAERNEDVGSLAISAMMNCLIEQARGNLETSSAHMLRSIELFESGGFPWGWISYGHYSVNALLVGDYDQAREAFELAGENRLEGVVWSGADLCYLLSGKARLGDAGTFELYERLRSQIPTGGEPMSSGPAMLLKGAIEALVLIGRDGEAAKLYPAMQELATAGIGVQDFTYGFHQRFAGMAATAAGEWDAAEVHFQMALELADHLGHRVEMARVRYGYARMLLSRAASADGDSAADRKRATAMLAAARDSSEEMGLAGLIKMLEALTDHDPATRD